MSNLTFDSCLKVNWSQHTEKNLISPLLFGFSASKFENNPLEIIACSSFAGMEFDQYFKVKGGGGGGGESIYKILKIVLYYPTYVICSFGMRIC